MQKQILFLLIAAFSPPALPADARPAHAGPAVLLKEVPQGYVVSVHACGEPLEKILRTVGTQCGLHIAWRPEPKRLHPVHIHFTDLPLEPAVRKLIQAAGITNYLVRYRERDNAPQSIAEVMIFGSGNISEETCRNAETMRGEKPYVPGDAFKPTAAAGDEYAQKIASFKDRYRWEDEETSQWAIYLLETMPEEAKDFGLDVLMKQLDKNSRSESAAPLNAGLFYRAIEDAAPPDIAPIMMRQVRRLSEQYHNRRAKEAGSSGDDFQHHHMSQEGR